MHFIGQWFVSSMLNIPGNINALFVGKLLMIFPKFYTLHVHADTSLLALMISDHYYIHCSNNLSNFAQHLDRETTDYEHPAKRTTVPD